MFLRVILFTMFDKLKYNKLLQLLLSKGFNPSLDWHETSNPNHLLIRHDIDFSIDYGIELAKFEYDQNIKSTYFFMLTSNFYNLISRQHIDMVNSIKDMGHKISIHFDPTSYENLDGFLMEKKIFENTFDIKLDIISIHRPGIFLKDNDRSLFGCAQTYQNKYFKEMHYISDSAGQDVFPMIDSYLKENRTKGLQLLIHPVWWIKKTSEPTQTLNYWLETHSDFLKNEIRRNCKSYKN